MDINEIMNQIDKRPVADQLKVLTGLFPEKVVFTSSFGIEDQVLTHMIFENDIRINVVTIDTGRLFPETYKVFNETRKKYGKPIHVYYPDHEGIEEMVTEKGPFSFYKSKEERTECCRIRKVVPLDRALSGMKIWVSGIRASQSDNRSKMDLLEYDRERQLLRFHPLFDWSFERIREFIKLNHVPYNILHDKGFVSIGCQPCTRAVKPGEDFRAGRWWWEKDDVRECGCHL